MKRNIIAIDREKCTGCGQCIPNCPEGAMQIIDGKAHLVGDLFCDGLGACLGHCPEGAISIEQREAGEYSEREVMKNIVKQGPNVIKAHLTHLKVHHQDAYVKEAMAYLKDAGIGLPETAEKAHAGACGCPGSRSRTIERAQEIAAPEKDRPSRLMQWPVQLHLISPMADYFRGSDLLVTADCVGYAVGDFHEKWLKGKTIVIACPKLDEGKDSYREKLIALIDKANINSLTVMIMEVPCCSGLLRLAQEAAEQATRKIPIRLAVVSIDGGIKEERLIP